MNLSIEQRLSVGYGYGYILGPSPVPPIYLAGSLIGPVLPPGWLDYTARRPCLKMWRGTPDLPARRKPRFAYPVRTRRAPGGSRCCIIKPLLAVG